MRRTMLIATAVIAAVVAVPAAGAIPLHTAKPVKVSMAPGTGGPRTTFKVSFRTPAQTGRVGSMDRSQTIDVQGTHRPGCVWSGQIAVPSAASGRLVHVSLSPGKLSRGATNWCAGTFKGSIVQSEHMVCKPPALCPMVEIRPQTVANFTFRVTGGE